MSEFVKLKMAQYGSPREGEAPAESLGSGSAMEAVHNVAPAGGPHFAVDAAVSTTVRGVSTTVLAVAPAHRFFAGESIRFGPRAAQREAVRARRRGNQEDLSQGSS